uniref:Calcium-transporting ATPase n=1 Tax=Panagrolaimus superbus TaxID=310955 RepID=A0A914Z2N8_9BILA
MVILALQKSQNTLKNDGTFPDGHTDPSAQLDELKILMEARGAEAIVKLDNDYGGIDGLCNKLAVDPLKGLPKNPKVLQHRRQKYGANVIPKGKPKPFWKLVWDASKDPTLLVLILSGVVSLALSFYEPTQEIADVIPSVDPFGLFSSDDSETTNEPLFVTNETVFQKNETTIAPHVKEKKGDHGSAWIEGVAILLCVVVVVLVTAINDYSKERQFQGLQNKIETGHQFSVIREGEAFDVPVADLVVGDIVRVKYGDLIPADGILLSSNDLKLDESSLTGESDHVKKNIESDPVILSGTYAMEGSGKMIITAVGVSSQTGIIMTLLAGGDSGGSSSSSSSSSSSTDTGSTGSGSSKSSSSDDGDITSKSVLQTKLSSLALQIIYCGTTIALIALIVLVVRYSVEHYVVQKQPFTFADLHNGVKYFIIAVTILVISIPEGLPLAIALSLTYSVKKMMKDNNLVRHMDACETMGNATTICSDKTGTLTTNQMTVVHSYLNGRYFEDQRSQPTAEMLPEKIRKTLCEAISINSAYNSMIIAPEKQGERVQQVGNKTECGLLGFVTQLSGSYDAIRKEHPEESLFKVYTFNSSRKSMMSVIKLVENGQEIGYRVFCKGASEILLSKCSYFMGAEAEIKLFSENERVKVMKSVIEEMAQNGLRTICVAYKDYVYSSIRPAAEHEVGIDSDKEIDWENESEIFTHFVGIAICGIQDPVRPEVPEAIKRCTKAGIAVRMVTGDNINTARAIALQCGILQPGDDYLVLEGKEFNNRIRGPDGQVSQELLDKVWPRLRVLARAQPVDKYNLVKGIIDSKTTTQREIVAVTGDGTNDGPALKKADVGFAMGIAGTDVAKEASDIILTDDNFTSIVKAVMWGRNVYDSISKFLQFQLTVNVVAVFTAFIGACTVSDSPLRAVHMLWINLIMDTLASLALATESPTDELLDRKPYGRKKSLISRTMVKNILLHAVYQLTVLLVFLYKGPQIFGIKTGVNAPLFSPPTKHFTIVFNTFVMMTLFNEINCRKVHGERNVFKYLSSNHMFIGIWISTFIGQILIVQYGGAWFSTAPLSLSQWIVCFGFGISELAFGQLVATIPAKKLPKNLRFGSGDAVATDLIMDRNYEHHKNMQMQQSRKNRRGLSLWMRAVAIVGLHYRVINAFRRNMREKSLGDTAPKMTSTAAEKWRQSYRRYRHRKHLEKKLARQRATSEGEGGNVSGVDENPIKLTTHRERKIHRHIREIARPHSFDRSGNTSGVENNDAPPSHPPPLPPTLKDDMNV